MSNYWKIHSFQFLNGQTDLLTVCYIYEIPMLLPDFNYISISPDD